MQPQATPNTTPHTAAQLPPHLAAPHLHSLSHNVPRPALHLHTVGLRATHQTQPRPRSFPRNAPPTHPAPATRQTQPRPGATRRPRPITSATHLA